MKKITFLFLSIILSAVVYGQDYAIAGGDFENWTTFTSNLNSYGLKSYATQGVGKGYNGSNSLNITATPTGNDYVFTALAPSSFPTATITAITFMVKGTSDAKSLSVNVYQDNSTYYKFNVGDLSSSDVTISSSAANSYTGTINTGGNWVKVTLNLTGITDYNKTAALNFLALKVGKLSNVALDIDNFEFVVGGSSGVSLTEIQNLFVADSKVIFETEKTEKVVIFNSVGQQVVNTFSVEGRNEISVPNAKGMYIVKVGNKTAKVAL